MKRKLTKQEIELTEKGITKRLKIIDDAMDTVSYNFKTKNFLKIKREYEDFIRPRTRKAQDEELDNQVKVVKQTIVESRDLILELRNHLKDGVEVKNEEEM